MKDKTYILDTNVILRFTLKDNISHFKKASELLSSADKGHVSLILIPQVIFECVFVLEKVYKYDHAKIAEEIGKFIKFDYLRLENREILVKSFNIYKNKNIDLVDCYLYILSIKNKCEVFTFDKDFKKLSKLSLD